MDARVVAARLRKQLTASGSDSSEPALTHTSAFMINVIAADDDARTSPSLLYLAAAARDARFVTAIATAGARLLPHEDAYAAAVQGDTLSDDHVCNVLLALSARAIPVPASRSPHAVTLLCVEKGWRRSLQAMVEIVPWAMHALQRLPLCVAAGERAAQEAQALVAGIRGGRRATLNAAVHQLTAAVLTASCLELFDWRPDAMTCARARVQMHAIVQVHEAAGTLRDVLVHPAAPSIDRLSCRTCTCS